MAAARGLVTGPGSRVAAVRTSRAADRSRSSSRSSAGAVTSSARSAFDGLGARAHGGLAGHAQRPDHLHLAGAGLGATLICLACTARAAAAASRGSLRPCRRRAWRSGRLTSSTVCPWAVRSGRGRRRSSRCLPRPRPSAGPDCLPRRATGGSQPGWSGPGWWRPGAEVVSGVGDMDLEMGVDPMVSWGVAGCAMLAMAVSSPWPEGGWHARRPGGQHCEESWRQARIRSRSSGWRASVAAARADRSGSRR